MRVSGSVTSLSWIPSEAVTGPMKLGFTAGLSHYDAPPPDRLVDLDALRQNDGFRFANVLEASAEFDGDHVVQHVQSGGVVMGATTVRLGRFDATFAAIPMPDLRPPVEVGEGWIRVTQTTGGRTALPMPRRISGPPFLRLQSPLVWTTLQLTLHADGTSEIALVGASPFPRHWVYDQSGELALKAGVAQWKRWLGQPTWTVTPWGEEDSPVVVAAAESALERQLSTLLMHGARKPRIRTLALGDVLTRQGDPGESLYLVLDGVLDVTVDGVQLGAVGPGAVLGEHAVLDASPRTATLTATTPVRVAEAPADAIDRHALARLAPLHRREMTGDAATT